MILEKRYLTLVYVSLNDGEYKVNKATDFTNLDNLNKAILASTAMPIVWPPVTVIENKFGEKYSTVLMEEYETNTIKRCYR